jgi:hypothetical protein
LKAETTNKVVEKNNIGLTPHLSKNILTVRKKKKLYPRKTSDGDGGNFINQIDQINQINQEKNQSDNQARGEGGKSQNSSG